jgi:hypothetical protein
LPWVFGFSNRAASYGEGSALRGLDLWQVWTRTAASFTFGETLPAEFRNIAGWIALAVVIVLLNLIARREGRRTLFLIFYIAVPTILLFALSQARPLFLERYLNGIAPAYYLVYASGLAYLLAGNRWPRVGAIIGIGALIGINALALNNYFFAPAYAKAPDWRGLTRYIADHKRAGDVILQNFPEMSGIYYDTSGLPLRVLPKDFLPDASTTRELQNIRAEFSRVWFIPAAPDFWDPEQVVEQWLDRYTDLLEETRISTFRVRLYATPREFLPMQIRVGARVGDFAELSGYRANEASRAVRLVLYWQVLKKPKASYTVFVHLTDATGKVIAQQDNPPVRGAYPTNAWQKNELVVDQYALTIPADARGEYLIVVGMYDPATSTRQPALDASGARWANDAVVLKKIVVP